MASITSLSNSSYNTSSIYGNRNILSGLASGMDTETMIENAVSGIKLKIQNLTRKRTKIEWQQEAYRSIIDKAVNLSQKYTSYASKTNLMSNSFFSNAVKTATNGTFKDKVSATGKTSSDIKINAVKQLATAATYTVSGLGGSMGDMSSITGDAFDLTKDLNVNNMSGTLTLQYGGSNGTSFDITFDELEDLSEMSGGTSAQKMANAINKKLGELSYTYSKNGVSETTTADKAIKAVVGADGKVTFRDALGNGNEVKISSSSGNMRKYAGETELTVDSSLNSSIQTSNYLIGKTLGITFNGSTKTINLSEVLNKVDMSDDATEDKNVQFQKALQSKLNDTFGTDKITASYEDGKLSFKAGKEGDTLSLGGTAIAALGFENGDTNYINPNKKLTDILGEDSDLLKKNRLLAVGEVNISKMTDEAGNRVKRDKNGKFYRVDDDNNYLYNFKVNGASITVNEDTTLEGLMNSINSSANAGVKVSYSKMTNEFKFTATETGANSKIEFSGLAADLFGPSDNAKPNDSFADNYGFRWPEGSDKPSRITVQAGSSSYSFDVRPNTTMQDFADLLNSSSGQQLNASYDNKTGQLTVTDQNGVEQEITITDRMGAEHKRVIEPLIKYTAGQDAIIDVEVNGKRFENLTRSSNTFEIDGLNITAKGAFNADGANAPDKDGNEYEAVTFTTTTDSDKIIEAIRSFVDDYNEMATELKNAYSTMPTQKSDGSRYEPLTAEEEEQYSESELKAYNEKAKQGILFGDSTLSSMYSKLLNAIQPGSTDGQTLREIGIGTSYSSGLTTLSLDEDKLRAALDSDPDKVRNAFTKTRDSGSATDGLMKTLQNTLDGYVKTTGEPKGVLITRAGSIKAPTSLNNNSLKSQMDNIDNQIDRWTDKMADQIDRYTSKFSKLEQLIAEMNSQSSALMGLMGGGSSY